VEHWSDSGRRKNCPEIYAAYALIKKQFIFHREHVAPITKTNRLSVCKEINAVYRKNYTAHIKALCEQNSRVLSFKLAVRLLINSL
jgi:hypothetical protein